MEGKLHFSLGVNNLEESVQFYSKLFGMAPGKLKPEVNPTYAKFDAASPAVVLTLEQSAEPVSIRGISHLGIRVGSLDEVLAARQRLTDAGVKTLDEMDTTCCYAVQDKIWLTDPTGYQWEVYHVKADAEVFFGGDNSADCVCCGTKTEPMGQAATTSDVAADVIASCCVPSSAG